MTGHGRFFWYELLTTDTAAAERFYGEVVGWQFGDSGQGGYIHLTAPDGEQIGGAMQLTPEMQTGGARPAWLGYINVGDVDATVASVSDEGGKVLMPAWTIENVGRIALLTDPQGAPFYVMKPSPPPERAGKDSTAFQPGAVGHCGWNELMTTEQAAALHFYARHFGIASEEKMSMGAMGDYCFLDHDGARIGAAMQVPADQMQPPHWNFYFGVDDIERAKRAVESGGGQVFMGPMEVPGGDWIVQGMDPQGAAFALVGPRKG